MHLSTRLRCPGQPEGVSEVVLRALFDWFVGLRIPYETVSNLQADVLIRRPPEIAASVAAGFGGHCVEHAVLFGEILREHGFAARYANGDHRDHVLGTVMTLVKPFTLVNVGERLFVCDTYYRGAILSLPFGGDEAGYRGPAIRRIDSATLAIESRRDGRLVGEDVVHEDSTLTDRLRQFETRYRTFSPFGITAPYYQVMTPTRCGLYYDPQVDRYVAHEGRVVFHLGTDELAGLRWLPRHLAALVPEVAARNRRERLAACAFLETGLYEPYYRRFLVRRDQTDQLAKEHRAHGEQT